MASWYRREIADDARLRMLLELGQVELAKSYLLAMEHRVGQEDDEAPVLTGDEVLQLQRLGLWRALDELITKQLADRARSRRARSKRHAASRDVTLEHVSSREVTDNTTDQSSILLSSKEDQKTAAAAPKVKKPKRQPAEATPLPFDWQPTEAHAELARKQRLTLAYQAEAFRAHAEATGRLAQSWNGAFATWLLKGDPEKEPRHIRGPSVSSGEFTIHGLPASFRRG